MKALIEIVRALLDKEANVKLQKYDDGFTALIFAYQNGHKNVVETSLWWSYSFTNCKSARTQWHSKDTNWKAGRSQSSKLQWRYSFDVCMSRRTKDIVRTLISKQADVNLRHCSGFTALIFASQKGHKSTWTQSGGENVTRKASRCKSASLQQRYRFDYCKSRRAEGNCRNVSREENRCQISTQNAHKEVASDTRNGVFPYIEEMRGIFEEGRTSTHCWVWGNFCREYVTPRYFKCTISSNLVPIFAWYF